VSWDDPVTPPAQALEVTFALSDANAASATWALGDTAGVVAHGTLQRGQTTTVRVPVDAGESYRRVGRRFGGARGADCAAGVRVGGNSLPVLVSAPEQHCGRAGIHRGRNSIECAALRRWRNGPNGIRTPAQPTTRLETARNDP